MSNPFLDALTRSPQPSEKFQEPLKILDEFCDAVRDYTEGRAKAWRERGFVTNYGQEWRIMLQSTSGGPEQPMFRAYVPAGGYPAGLDLHQAEVTEYPDGDSIRKALVQFLEDPSVKEQIRYFAS